VTGKFYYKQLPKSDVRVILAVLVILLSFVLPAIQYQKWKKAMDYVKYAAANNLGLKAGGTKETMEVFRRAAERYEQEVAGGSGGAVKQAKMMKDPEFLRIIDEVKIIEQDVSLFQWSVLCSVCLQIVGAVQVEGGYRKPNINDVFVVKLAMLPLDIVRWARKRYRYHYQGDQVYYTTVLLQAASGPPPHVSMSSCVCGCVFRCQMRRNSRRQLRPLVWVPGNS
jgi:hypothetical protein